MEDFFEYFFVIEDFEDEDLKIFLFKIVFFEVFFLVFVFLSSIIWIFLYFFLCKMFLIKIDSCMV